MEHSQSTKILHNYLIIIFVAEQRGKIIGAQDKPISQSGAPVSEYTWDPLYPPHYHTFGGTRGVNSKIVVGFRFLHGLLTNKNRRIPTPK
jgi:hypothetical protein